MSLFNNQNNTTTPMPPVNPKVVFQQAYQGYVDQLSPEQNVQENAILTPNGIVNPTTGQNSFPNSKVLAGVDLSKYATDPQHFQKVSTIYNSLPDFKTADDINAHIKQIAPKSKITGDMVLNASKQYGIDPKLMVAIMRNDSDLGTLGLGAKTNNPGNIANNDRGNKFTYPNVNAGVVGVAKFLSEYKQ